MRITSRLKEIKKRRALRGKQRVGLLMNSAVKRTVVLLNPSFFTSLIPSSLAARLKQELSKSRFDHLDKMKKII